VSKLDDLVALVAASPRNPQLLQKLAELHQKRGHSAEAAQTLLRLAEVYGEDGFFLKAVALAKQVLILDAKCIDARLRLVEWHQSLELIDEAKAIEGRFATLGLSTALDGPFLAFPRARA
jgi:predicted negative regulator of RcsB-dependent stress response